MILVIIIYSILMNSAYGKNITINQLPFEKSEIKKILKGKCISKCKVKTIKHKKQSMKYNIAAYHSKPCKPVLKKLSKYEDYKKYISVIKDITYKEKTQNLYASLNHVLLPFNISIYVKIPRIKKPGIYNFIFKKGFLPNLKGKIFINQENNRCLFLLKANWLGEYSGIPSPILYVMAKIIGTKSVYSLFNATGHK